MRLTNARGGVLAALVVFSVAPGLPASPASAAGRPPAIDRVRLPFPAYDGTLTPYTFSIGYPLVTLVYDTLMWRDADGVPQPWLARSVMRSNGGRRLTIQLRDGVRWHDGRPLTAADVAFTFRYVAARYQARFTPQLSDVARVRATGRLTATIDLKRPSLGFEDQPLADLPILPRHLWRNLPAGRAAPPGLPVGSGPYRLASAKRTQGYVLDANRGYFMGSPRVREIRVPIIGDADRTYKALRSRQVDMVPLNLAEQTATDLSSALGIGLERGPSYFGTALVLNVRRPPFDDPAVRREVAGAMDVQQIVRNVTPAVAAVEGFIHPASRWSPGVRPDKRRRFDPRATHTVNGLGPGPLRVLGPAQDPVRLEAARQVVLALKRADASATLVKLSRADLDRALGLDGSTPDFDAAIQSTPALASYDPDGLTRLFGSDPRQAPLNVSGYSSAKFDALAGRVASATDPQQRRRATRAELELLANDVPAFPLFFSQGTFAYRSAIYDGWSFVKGMGILDKRSFLAGAKGSGSGSGPVSPPQRPASPKKPAAASGSGFSFLNILTVVLVVVVLAAGTVALLQRRADRPR